jgi:hypothetical protein
MPLGGITGVNGPFFSPDGRLSSTTCRQPVGTSACCGWTGCSRGPGPCPRFRPQKASAGQSFSCTRRPLNSSACCRPTGAGWRISPMSPAGTKSGPAVPQRRRRAPAGLRQWRHHSGLGAKWTRTVLSRRHNAVTSVPIRTSPTFSAGAPMKLFDGPYLGGPYWRTYDVSPDGLRFLMVKDSAAAERLSTPMSLVVVLNWFEELKRRLPASGR